MAHFESRPDTFIVEEIAAYEPSGEGPHTYAWIEKRDLTTAEAVRRLARALGVPERDVGSAGLKDRHATTRQWISLPGVDPQAVRAAAIEGVSVLDVRPHRNKLRTGHLRGNRFEVVLTLDADDEAGRAAEAERITSALARLAADGLPNRYGEQRFGARGDNVRNGLAILRGERTERDGRLRRLLLSSVQSAVFNEVLARRMADGSLRRVREGDVLQKVASGGLFVTTAVDVDQARVDANELVITGPMPGSRSTDPPPASAAALLEAEAMAAVGTSAAELAAYGRDLPGARRPLLVRVDRDGGLSDERAGGQLRLRFALPAGSYATTLLDALGVPTVSSRTAGAAPQRAPVLT